MSEGLTLRLAHHHPGRIRVRSETLELNTETFALLAPLNDFAGVTNVLHNPLTGSVVVAYDPTLTDSTALLDELCRLGGFDSVIDEAEDKGSSRPPEQVIISVVKSINQLTRELTGNDLKTVAPGALASAAIVSFVLHDQFPRLPRWDSLLWWSYSMFVDWNHEHVRGEHLK